MSSIDAAIIKALVEHIGGNPDSIPDGTIGGGSSASTHFEPLPDSNYNRDRITISGPSCTIKLPIDEFVPGHTVLRLKRRDSQGTIDTWLCTNIESRSKTSYVVVLTLIEDLDTMKLSATQIIKLIYQGPDPDTMNSTHAPITMPLGNINFATTHYEPSANWTDEDDEIGPFLLAVEDDHGLSALSHRINYSMLKLLISLVEKPHVIEVA